MDIISKEEEQKINNTLTKYQEINGKLNEKEYKNLYNYLVDLALMIGVIPSAEELQRK